MGSMLLFFQLCWTISALFGGGSAPSYPSDLKGCTQGNKNFEYFELVLQWPPAFGGKLGAKTNHWTIHGLWPSRIQNPDTYPCDCTQESFDEKKIGRLRNSMEYYWPSLKGPDNNVWFWSHEWEKHGTCSSPFIDSQEKYFDTTMSMRLKIDPAVLLRDFKPSKTPYPFKDVYERLSTYGKVVMHCANNGQPNQAILEVVFCMAKSNELLQYECPEEVRVHEQGKCNPNFPITILPGIVPP